MYISYMQKCSKIDVEIYGNLAEWLWRKFQVDLKHPLLFESYLWVKPRGFESHSCQAALMSFWLDLFASEKRTSLWYTQVRRKSNLINEKNRSGEAKRRPSVGSVLYCKIN